ncbi:hypothetical protein KXD93_22100 [Mucilaginibacter sp. BJC16-A38]|uniref:hypothetical protein n=1 Tax=Mucilaginibacter phenanthrenivorans TaxID=1234842 RepID=UPI002158247D|nr:hypothetical protein [Mucilaginibacter phenanthrenivorans]MCR8560362.1 hypothetical protein [Mucilaginibacter phenanthrenivorans]
MPEAFHQDCIKEDTKIVVESGHKFIASSTVISTADWRAVFNEEAIFSGSGQYGNKNKR